MNIKGPYLIILAITNTIICMIFNFQEFLMGSPATIKNLIVTAVYLAIWSFVLLMGIKNRRRGIVKFGAVFWIITFFLAAITAYVNVTGASVDWVLPFAVLLMGQWYGIGFFVNGFLAVAIVVASISILMLSLSLRSLKNTKVEK